MLGELIVAYALAYGYAQQHFPETTAMVVSYLPHAAVGAAVAIGFLIGGRIRAIRPAHAKGKGGES
jgi:hypothetical protein